MTTIKRLNSIEATPYSQGNNKFHYEMEGSGITNMKESYFEFVGQITHNLPNNAKYNGVALYGNRNPLSAAATVLKANGDNFQGPSCLIKHMRVSSDKLGLIEDNRYANIINQHLQTFQKGRAEVNSNNYYGTGNKFVVVNDE